MRAEVISVRDVDPRLLTAWNDLAADAVEPNPFHQAECVLPAVRWLAGGRDVGLLVVWSGERLVFLLPIEPLKRYRRLPIPTVAWWRHPYAYLGTPLVSREADAARAWATALDHLARERTPLFAVELCPLDETVGPALVSQPSARRPVVLDSYERPMLHRRPEPTYLDDRLSSRHQKNLRRYRRRLAEELGGDVVLEDRSLADDDRFAETLEGFLTQEAAGWKGRDGGAFASRPGHAEFFREVATAFRRSGQLELWTLGTGERTAAHQCNVRAGTTNFHWKVAYDEELARWSPGLQLEIEMVKSFHDDPRVDRIDSCTAAGTKVSEQLYPDRRPIGLLLVPLGGRLPRLVVASVPHARRAYHRLRRRPDVATTVEAGTA